MFVSLLLLAAGLFALTHLRADTSRPTLWLWMAITGLGIGPSFAVFTLIVQNTVERTCVGVATASLTFFQQIGGTIGLTLAGTVFAGRMVTEVPAQLASAGVPPQVVAQFAGGSGGGIDLTGTGDLGKAILAAVPEQARSSVAPLIPNIVDGIHQAFSISMASTFWIGIVAALIGAAFIVFLKETPMRATFEMPEEAEPEAVDDHGRRQLVPAGATAGASLALLPTRKSPCAN